MTPDSLPNELDRALVRDFLRTRSESAFLRLYDRHTEGVYRFAARLCGGAGEEASEIVQETWVRALDRLSAFRFESALRTWLCGIAFNLWREGRRRVERDRKLQVIEGTRIPEPVQPSQVNPRLEEALANLPDGYREILLLHDVEGFTHEEIARMFGIVEGTSKSQLHRARRALREALEERGIVKHE